MNIQKALVVDDSKVAHLALKKLLSERGIQVDWVGSGEDSIKYLEDKPSPDIVFMDIMMPGMGGFEATKAISNHPKISPPPIVMCSGNASERDQSSASQSGAVGFLAKPYTGDELDQILNKVQALSAAAPAPAPAPAAPAIDVESIVGRAEEAARKAAAEAVREMVEQTAQTLAEAARNTAAEEARQVAETTARGLMAESRVEPEPSVDVAETARNVAAETARAVALETARAAAVESARSMAEQVAREIAAQTARTVAEGVAAEAPTMVTTAPAVDHDAIQQALEAAQQSLAARLQGQLEQRMDDALNRFAGSEDLKRRINQAAQDAAKPLAESAAREAAAQAARAAPAAPAPAEGGSAAMGRANIALAAAVIALIAAIALPFVL